MIAAGESIETSAMLTQEFAVLIFVRELLRAEEEHVFTEVRQPRQVGWVTHVTNMDIQGCGRLVCCLIRDQQHLDNTIMMLPHN